MSEQKQVPDKKRMTIRVLTKERMLLAILEKKRRARSIREMEQGYREMGTINLDLAESAVFADEELQVKIERKLAEREQVWS